jgi:hypothetical protein
MTTAPAFVDLGRRSHKNRLFDKNEAIILEVRGILSNHRNSGRELTQQQGIQNTKLHLCIIGKNIEPILHFMYYIKIPSLKRISTVYIH